MKISSLDDIQKLEAKDLREILKYNLKSTGWIRADLVLKVYALLMWHVLPSSSGENRELLTDVQDLEQNQSDFRYEVTMVRISALGWASNLRNLPEMNFNQLYDYPVVSHITHISRRGNNNNNNNNNNSYLGAHSPWRFSVGPCKLKRWNWW